MSVKMNAPIRLVVPSGTWVGVVRRVGTRLDLLVETSGPLRVGDTGRFEMDLGDKWIGGKLRVRNGGERSGPYARYILQITEITGRHRQQLTAWVRGDPGERAAVAEARTEQVAEQPEQRRGGRQLPKVTVEVDQPVALRTSAGAVEGTLVRFHGNEFLVEVAAPIELESQAFFQFEVPGFGIDVFGTAQVGQEAWRDHDTCGYVLSMHLMRRADRDLLREWLEDQAGDALDQNEQSSGISATPTDMPSSVPPQEVQARVSSSSRGRSLEGSGGERRSGRGSIRDILLRRFFKGAPKG
jgi:hypothetical protein